jgi:hypothetical protein
MGCQTKFGVSLWHNRASRPRKGLLPEKVLSHEQVSAVFQNVGGGIAVGDVRRHATES